MTNAKNTYTFFIWKMTQLCYRKTKYMDNVISYSNRHDIMVSLKPNPKGQNWCKDDLRSIVMKSGEECKIPTYEPRKILYVVNDVDEYIIPSMLPVFGHQFISISFVFHRNDPG